MDGICLTSLTAHSLFLNPITVQDQEIKSLALVSKDSFSFAFQFEEPIHLINNLLTFSEVWGGKKSHTQ